jgi:uncharacterized glyoxalase superfamily protein PhnB
MMTRKALIPCLRYADAPAAIDFLCDAFGFVRHAVYADDQDPSLIHHAQLSHGDTMVMLGSARPGPFVELYGWRSIEEAGGITMSICMTVDDPDAHCARAKAAGAEIIAGPYDNQGYPGRAYDARDPGGYVWNVTSYDPWAAPQD